MSFQGVVAINQMTHCNLLTYILSGSLPFRKYFISQDPRLSYLHVHCKCNVNESSDKIFLYFVITTEFLYRRIQWRLTCMSTNIFE